MFAIHSYMEKIYDIQWYFNENDKSYLEGFLHVTFERENDYYVISDILYSALDIIIALNDLNFEFKKMEQIYKVIIYM